MRWSLLTTCKTWPSIKYVTLFLANFYPPSPLSHFVTHPGIPPKVRHTSRTSTPDFLVGLVQEVRTKAPCTNSLSIVCGVLSGRVCQRVFGLEGFVRGGFVHSSFCHNTYVTTEKLNITLNFMFNMNDKKCISVTSHALDLPSPCHKLSHLLGPPPAPSSVTYTLWTAPYQRTFERTLCWSNRGESRQEIRLWSVKCRWYDQTSRDSFIS